MILDKLNDQMPNIRKNIILGIFLLLILITSFFSGEWNTWLQAFIMVLTSLLLAYVLFLYLKSNHVYKNCLEKYLYNPNLYLFLFLAVVIITSFFSVNKYNSFSQLFLLIAYIGIYFAAYKYFNNHKKIKIIIHFIFYTGFLASLITLIMFTFQSSNRANGLLFNANALGGYLIFSFLIGLIFLFNLPSSKIKKTLDIVGLIIIFLALLLTYSYTAWASLIIPVAGVIIFYRKKVFTKKNMNWLILVLVFAFVSLTFFRFSNTNDLVQAVKVYENISTEHVNFSFQQRMNHNLAAWDIFNDYKFTGSGYNTYQSTISRYAYTVDEQPRYTHNYYLQTLSDTGIFGFIFFIGFICLTLKHTYQLIRRDPEGETGMYSLMLLSGLLGASINSLFDFTWQFPAAFILFWIYSGLVNSRFQAENVTEKIVKSLIPENKNSIIIRMAGLIFVFLLLLRGLSLLVGGYFYQSADIAADNGDLEKQWSTQLVGYKFDPKPNELIDYIQAKLKFPYLLDVEDYKDMENKMTKLISINEEDYFAHWMLGRVYTSQKKFNQAVTEYGEAIKFNPVFRPDFYYDRALVYYQQGNYLMAKQTIYSILEKYPEDHYSANPNLPDQLAFLYLLLGQCYEAEDNIEKAIDSYKKSLDKKSDFEPAESRLKKLF